MVIRRGRVTDIAWAQLRALATHKILGSANFSLFNPCHMISSVYLNHGADATYNLDILVPLFSPPIKIIVLRGGGKDPSTQGWR